MTVILFLYKYFWIITLVIFYILGWIHTIQQIKTELKGEESIYDPIFNPFPFYVFWICLHCAFLIGAFIYIFFSSLNYWQTGELLFFK